MNNETATATLSVRSVVFSHGGHIPPMYTCEGDNVNPPLDIIDYPQETKTLAIITEDPDAPSGVFTHWLAWNISPNEPIAESSVPGISGTNSFSNLGYGGPCPPQGQEHRYYFRVYALDAELDLLEGATKEQLQTAMQGHIIAQGELMGLYKKPE